MSTPAESPTIGAALESVPCVLCGGTKFVGVYRRVLDQLGGEQRFDVVRCNRCGLVQTNPRPTPAAIGAYYPGEYAPYSENDDRAPARVGVFVVIRKLLSLPYRLRFRDPSLVSAPPRPDARMLDVGCGAGELLGEMRHLGWEVWGIEPDATAASHARARAGRDERVVTGTVPDARLSSASYDLVTLYHVLEHLHDPIATLRQIHDWLRPDGSLRVLIPNLASAESRVFRRHWYALEVPRHLYHYTPETATRVLSSAGFDVVSMRPQFQGSSFGASIQQLASRRFQRRAARQVTSGWVYFAALPFGWLLTALGNAACLDVVARPRQPQHATVDRDYGIGAVQSGPVGP